MTKIHETKLINNILFSTHAKVVVCYIYIIFKEIILIFTIIFLL